MAEPASMMQLGIEAAREGNREEARRLFRLTLERDPDNAQAWLWLAGVAENREERVTALSRTLELDPSNEMARKGLQALGVEPAPARPVAPPPAQPAGGLDDDDDPFAELNNLSDVMASDSAPVRRTDPIGDELDSADAYARSAPPPRASDSRSAVPPRTARIDDLEDEEEPARRGASPLLMILLFVVGLGLIALLVFFFLPDLFGPRQANNGAGDPAAAATSVAATAAAATAEAGLAPTSETSLGGAEQPTAEPTTGEQPTAEPTTGEQPTAEPTAGEQPTAQGTVAPADPALASPAIVPANTPLSSEGWLYDFNQPTYAAPIIGPLGQFQPNNGRFVVVLLFAVNNTGSEQAIPPEFFVIKDAQGRVWQARPEVSAAYVIPGQNADLNHTQPLPPDGLTRSVALIFDVAPDATDLVFFARSNPSQGWLVLRAV